MAYLSRVVQKAPDAAIAQMVRVSIDDAQKTWTLPFQDEFPATGIGIAPISARDVAGTNQAGGLFGGVAGSAVFGVTAVTASTWTDWINITIDDRTYHIVTGVFNRTNSPNITMIRTRANGQDQPAIDIEQMYNWDLTQAYLEQPYTVRPGANHTVRVFTERTIAGVPAERIGLLGFILAKRAYLIHE